MGRQFWMFQICCQRCPETWMLMMKLSAEGESFRLFFCGANPRLATWFDFLGSFTKIDSEKIQLVSKVWCLVFANLCFKIRVCAG
jgi:hypothetical protein